MNYAGDVVEESSQTFASIATAITNGTLRMNDLDADDTRPNRLYFRSTSHLRSR